MKKPVIISIILLVVIGLWNLGARYVPNFGQYFQGVKTNPIVENGKVKVITEESVVIDVVDKVTPSVVTISVQPTSSQQNLLEPDNPFGFPSQRQEQSNEPRNIGSGFIVGSDGMIVTNKHVVSDRGTSYSVITSNNKQYKVQQIYRDPLNDIAILKINPNDNLGNSLKPLELGDSGSIKVGQMAIAIGTPLGEFNNTVTTGVISGLGRGITAGSPFEGYAERLDNVIQTDAAINPGNSGGPLLNSAGQVIGVNTAVSQNGQNIGFALPINVIKDSLKNFNETGQFNRPFLGVAYQMISREAALRNEVPEGAYVQQVVQGSAADKAGIQEGDIITQMDGQKLQAEQTEIAAIIAKKKIGDKITLTVFRENSSSGQGNTVELTATLEAAPEE